MFLVFLSFIVLILAWIIPLISQVFLKSSLVFSIHLFSSTSLPWSLMKIFLSLPAVLWNSAFNSVHFSHSVLSAIVTPWTAVHQAFLSITNSRSLLKLMLFESVIPSNHLIHCCSLLPLPSIFPASGSFPRSQFFTSGGQNIGVFASASVLLMNIQDWFPLGLTGWISLQ